MNSLLLHYLTLWKPFAYLIVFLGMIFEGDAILYAAGFLTHLGFFNFGGILLTLFSGVLVGDSLWYFFGEWLNGSTSFINRWVIHIVEPFDSHILKRPFHTIFISKFIYGVHHAVLMRASALDMDFKKFIRIDLVSSFFWILVVGGLGFGSSATFTILKHYLRFVEIAFLIGIIIFLLVWHGVLARLLKKTL